MGTGKLFVVGTPIGNLGDLTSRARDVLGAAALVMAEDTRRTRALLSALGIGGRPVERLDAHAADADVRRVVARLEAGDDVALVTDAGTPSVSDPGAALVKAATEAGAAVVAIPGASAVVAALSVAGFGGGGFRFLGFLPRSGRERREALERVVATPEPVVLFEAPQRLAETLADLGALMPERDAVVAREITKLHEELVRGTLRALAADAREWRGEITLVLGPKPEAPPARWDEAAVDARIDAELARGKRAKQIAEALSLESGWSKREVYERVTARK